MLIMCTFDSKEFVKQNVVQCQNQFADSGPEVIKLFLFSAQLRLKFILLTNVKMPTIVGILTFVSRITNVKMPTIVGIFSSPEPKAHR